MAMQMVLLSITTLGWLSVNKLGERSQGWELFRPLLPGTNCRSQPDIVGEPVDESWLEGRRWLG
jgi:hypothetical protein